MGSGHFLVAAVDYFTDELSTILSDCYNGSNPEKMKQAEYQASLDILFMKQRQENQTRSVYVYHTRK